MPYKTPLAAGVGTGRAARRRGARVGPPVAGRHFRARPARPRVRRHPRRLALPLLLATLLAGCLGGGSGPEDHGAAPEAPEAREVPVTLEGCVVVEALFVLPADAVRRHVPDAFDLAERSGRVMVALGGFSCAEGNASGLLAIAVQPKHEALLDEGVDRYFWRPEVHVLPGSALGRAYEALGARTIPASVQAAAAPTGGSFAVEAEAGWTHRVDFLAGPVSPESAALGQGVFREYSEARGGVAYLQGSFGPPGGPGFGLLPGTVQTGEGTLARDILGPSAQAPVFVLSDAPYLDPRLGFIPLPPA